MNLFMCSTVPLSLCLTAFIIPCFCVLLNFYPTVPVSHYIITILFYIVFSNYLINIQIYIFVPMSLCLTVSISHYLYAPQSLCLTVLLSHCPCIPLSYYYIKIFSNFELILYMYILMLTATILEPNDQNYKIKWYSLKNFIFNKR